MASPRATLYAVMLVSLLGTAGIALPYPVLSPFFLDGTHENGLTTFLGLDPKLFWDSCWRSTRLASWSAVHLSARYQTSTVASRCW